MKKSFEVVKLDDQHLKLEIEVSKQQLWILKQAMDIISGFSPLEGVDVIPPPIQVTIATDADSYRIIGAPNLGDPPNARIEFHNSTEDAIQIRFFSDQQRTVMKDVYDSSGAKLLVQPIDIAAAGSATVTFKGQGAELVYLKIWEVSAEGASVLKYDGSSGGGGADMGINYP